MGAGYSKWLIFGLLAVAFLGMLFTAQRVDPPAREEIAYSAFKALVSREEVSEVVFEEETVFVYLKADPDKTQPLVTQVPEIGDPELLPLLERYSVVVESRESAKDDWSGTFLGFLPWLVLIGFYIWFWNRLYKNAAGRFGGRDVDDFLAGTARKEDQRAKEMTFDDVAGQESAKREVAELVEFLKDPERYRKLGAEPPRGVLLMGPPGTGKTLLARALAGEAGVPFFNISASEFIEMFVGVGASRVRKMFDEAKKRAPSIIFIDELDAVGRVRGTGLGSGHDEREQTLNQILSEMDGFSGHEAVIVLAATNRPDVLDPALLRPGRFDRHVTLELPDRTAREAILKVHLRKIPTEPDVDLATLASATPGFSGADIKNLVNEAAIAAAREKKSAVSQAHLDAMREKVMMGAVRTMAIHADERHRLAVHEAGHTIVAFHRPKADPLYKVTIIPRGRTLGSTHMLPEEERHTLPEDYLKDRLAVMLGGRMAEQELIGTFSSGADDDIREATKLARAMVARWGMSSDIGPIDLRQSEDHPFLGREIAQPRHFSEATARQVDLEVQKLLKEASDAAREVIRKHRAGLERLVAALEETETLDQSEIEACLGPQGGHDRAGGKNSLKLVSSGAVPSPEEAG